MHTEVKRTSSLPTAMFDATDPMLEMQLAETTADMMQKLRCPAPELESAVEGQPRRLERIDADELSQLTRRIGTEPEPVDLFAELGAEYIAILADCCMTADEPIARDAARHMCHDFGITPENVDDAVRELFELIREAELESKPHFDGRDGEDVVQRISLLLRDQASDEDLR